MFSGLDANGVPLYPEDVDSLADRRGKSFEREAVTDDVVVNVHTNGQGPGPPHASRAVNEDVVWL